MKRKNIAYIIGAQRNGLGIARSLGEIGVKSVFVDSNPLNLGFASKYCIGKITGFDNEQELLKKLKSSAEKMNTKPILLMASDEGLLFVSRFRDLLKEHFLFSLPDYDLTQLVNKELMYKLAQNNSIHIPNTYFLSQTKIENVIDKIKFPCIIKGHYSHILYEKFSKQLFKANSAQDLRLIYKELSDFKDQLLIQEIIEGEDDKIWFFGAYFNDDSIPLTCFTGRKLRQYPIEFGSTSLAEYAPNSYVEETSVGFLKKIHFKGLCDIEFKQGPDEKFYFMEVNPRVGLWHRLGNFIGKDIVQTYYLDLLGEKYTPKYIKTAGKWIAEDMDLISAFEYARKNKLSLKEWLISLKGAKVFALWDVKDLKPFFYHFFIVIPKVVFKKFFGFPRGIKVALLAVMSFKRIIKKI